MKRFITTLILLLTVTVTVLAQGGYTIKGVVVDTARNSKLNYVRIGLLTTDSIAKLVGNAFTDNNGKFSFTDIPSGQYILKAFLVGYDFEDLPVTVSGSSKVLDLGTIGMRKQSHTLGEVHIVTEKPVYLMDGEKTLYNVSEDPTIQDGNASDALQNAPGVEVDIEGNITLRGVSSVEIWINDKPSKMNEEGLKTFIQQLPANAIERIEVITNPSARYSAKGTGGIINVITTGSIKKNSFFSFGLRGSSKPDLSPWFSYVYSNEKLSLNFHLHANYWLHKSHNENSATSLNDQFDTSFVLTSMSDSKNHSIGGGFFHDGSYTFDTLNSISWWAGCHPSIRRNFSYSDVMREEYIFNEGEYAYLETDTGRGWNVGGFAGVWFDHRFKNDRRHKISTNLGFHTRNGVSTNLFARDYSVLDLLDKYRNDLSSNRSFNTDASIDYTVPYHKNGTISVGLNGDFSNSWNLSQIDTLDRISDLYQIDSLRLKDSRSREQELDAYFTIEHKFGNFTIKGGLRGEYTHNNLEIVNASYGNVNKDYFSLFPSLHLSYRTKSMHNFKLSYTRRVSNPSNGQLSSFINYGEDSYSMGNPELKSTFTNSVEAGWTKFFKKFGFVGVNAYFRNSTNEISSLTDVAYSDVFNRIVTFSQPMNAGHSYRVGGDFNVNYRLKAFMSIRFYANMAYAHSEFDFRNMTEPQIVDNFNYSFRLNFWAKLWKVLEVNASANYRSKSVSLFTTNRPGYSIDCGLRADFCKRKISVHLSVDDIFNWNKTVVSNNNPYYISTGKTTYNSRSIKAGITFRFGKMELESKASQGNAASAQGGGNAM